MQTRRDLATRLPAALRTASPEATFPGSIGLPDGCPEPRDLTRGKYPLRGPVAIRIIVRPATSLSYSGVGPSPPSRVFQGRKVAVPVSDRLFPKPRSRLRGQHMHRIALITLIAPLVLVLPRASGDFVNGSFEAGLTGWTTEYAFVNANCDHTYLTWLPFPSGHAPPTTVSGYSDYLRTIAPYCGNMMAKVNASLPGNYATRLSQTIVLTPVDLSESCGAARIRARYIAFLGTGGGHSYHPLEESHLRFQVLRNGILQNDQVITANFPAPPTWWHPTGPFYVREGTYEYLLGGAAPGDTVTIRLIAADCCKLGHNGIGYFDCVELQPSDQVFAGPESWTNQPPPAAGWRAADFTGDGRDDLLRWETVPTVLASLGGSFAAPLAWSGPGLTGSDRGGVGDFNADGRQDLLEYLPTTGAFVHLSDGVSQFLPTPAWAGAQPGYHPLLPLQVKTGDFNGDGRADMLFQAFGDPPRILLTNAAGTAFQAAQTNWTGQPWGYGGWYVGDFDGDARSDLGRWTAGGGFEVLRSTGTAFLPAQSWTRHGVGPTGRWTIGDFNCDGRDDLMRQVGPPSLSRTEVLLSTGTSFGYPVPWQNPMQEARITAGDFDGSRPSDIARESAVFRTCIPCGCMLAVDRGAPCNPLNGSEHLWTFSVRNLTNTPVSSIAISNTGSVTVTPSVITLPSPLLPGYWTTQTVTVTNAPPGEYCPTISMLDAGKAELCSASLCFTTATCDCMRILVDDFVCTDDGSGDFFLTFRIQNISGFPMSDVWLAGSSPATADLVPSTFPQTLPHGATSAPYTGRVTGVAGLPSVCLDLLTLLDTGGDLTFCRGRVCVDVPVCPGTPGWCCVPGAGCIAVPGSLACSQAGGTFGTNVGVCATCIDPPWTPPTGGPLQPVALGGANLTVDPDLNLVIAPLGASGADGVHLTFGAVNHAVLEGHPIDPLGEIADASQLRLTAVGVLEDIAEQTLGELAVWQSGPAFTILPDFLPILSGTFEVEAYLDGSLVTVLPARDMDAGVASAWPTGWGPLLDDTGILRPGFVLRWAAPLDVLFDGLPVVCDELRILADGSPLAVQAVTGVDVTGLGLEHLVLTSADVDRIDCTGDVDGDGVVSLADLAYLLTSYAGTAEADLDGNGITDLSDLAILLANFGAQCP